jgi:hypothetical protein
VENGYYDLVGYLPNYHDNTFLFVALCGAFTFTNKDIKPHCNCCTNNGVGCFTAATPGIKKLAFKTVVNLKKFSNEHNNRSSCSIGSSCMA